MERSQTEWAKLLGVTKGLTSHWETGRSRPSYEVLARIAQVSGLSCDYLITGQKMDRSLLQRVTALPPALREWALHQMDVAERACTAMPFAYDAPVPHGRRKQFEDYLWRLGHEDEARDPLRDPSLRP
jgi:DNA-binding XRE family transcriptional regulator